MTNKWLSDDVWAQDSRTAELLSKAKLIDLIEERFQCKGIGPLVVMEDMAKRLEVLENFVRQSICICSRVCKVHPNWEVKRDTHNREEWWCQLGCRWITADQTLITEQCGRCKALGENQ